MNEQVIIARCSGFSSWMRSIKKIALAGAAFVALSGAQAEDPVVPLIEAHFPSGYTGNNGNFIRGKLYVPPSHDQPGNTASYPLVIAFHGKGDYYDTTTQKSVKQPYKVFKYLLLRAEQEGFMVYMPQIMHSTSPGAWSQRNLETAMRVVSRLTRSYRIDLNRIYFTGISLGGGGIWRAMHRHSGLPAASLSICASNNSDWGQVYYEPMVDIPILAFHALDDGPPQGIVPPSHTQKHINTLLMAKGLGSFTFPSTNESAVEDVFSWGIVKYHRLTTGNHEIWDSVYQRNDVYQWLLSHTNNRLGKLEVGESIFFDLGNHTRTVTVGTSSVDFGAAVWDDEGYLWNSNNLALLSGVVDECLIPFAKTTDGKQTDVSLDLVAGFVGFVAVSGTNSLYGDIGSDGIITAEGATATVKTGKLKIRGLTPEAAYRVEIYGYHSDDDGGRGRKTTYQIGTETHCLECAFNLTETVVFQSVEANPAGELEILVYATPDTSSRYGQINNIKLTRLGPDAGSGPQIPPLVYQDFEESDVVADYVSSNPDVGQFHDISSEVEGGIWSIEEYSLPGVPGGTSRRLVLTRPDNSTPGINGAGFTRLSGTSGNPEVVAVSFDVTALLTPMIGYNAILATLDVGNITSLLDYSSATPGTSTAARLNIRGVLSGSTSRFRFAVETDSGEVLLPSNYSKSFDMGSEVSVLWMVNSGTSSYEYARYDDPQTTRTLAGGSSDLWVISGTTGPVLINSTNLVRSSSFTSSTAGGIRFRGRTPKGVVLTLDNLTITPLR